MWKIKSLVLWTFILTQIKKDNVDYGTTEVKHYFLDYWLK